MFVFIHAVKAFHTHNFSYLTQTENLNKNATAVNAGFSCAICDFQIAKDSDADVAIMHIETPVHDINYVYGYTLPVLSSFSISSFVRGPPAFVSCLSEWFKPL